MCQPFKYKYYESAKNLPIYLPKHFQDISIIDVYSFAKGPFCYPCTTVKELKIW